MFGQGVHLCRECFHRVLHHGQGLVNCGENCNPDQECVCGKNSDQECVCGKGGCRICGCCVIGSDLFGGIGRTPDHGEECNSNQKCDRGEGQGVDFVRIRKIRAKYPFF